MKTRFILLLLSLIALSACQKKLATSKSKPQALPQSQSPTVTSPQSTGTRGGGDTDVVAFLHYGTQITEWAQVHSEHIAPADSSVLTKVMTDLRAQMDRASGPSVVFVDDPLKDHNGADKMALFVKDPLTITVSRPAWKTLTTEERYTLVALEIMGASGFFERYHTAELIKTYIHEISGIPLWQDQAYITRSGFIFKSYFDFMESIPYFRSTIAIMDDSRFSGYQLLKKEEKRIKFFKSLARGFRGLPLLFQMDILSTTQAAYTGIEIDGSGISWSQHSGFGPISEGLTKPLSKYLEAKINVIQTILDESLNLSGSDLKELKAIQAGLKDMTSKFLTLAQGGNIIYPHYGSPFSHFEKSALGQIRHELLQRNCKVPSTFTPLAFNKDTQILMKETAVSEVQDLKTLYQNALKVVDTISSQLEDLDKRWMELDDKIKIDSIKFKKKVLFENETLAENTDWLFEISKDYLRAYIELKRDNSEEELINYQEILSNLRQGKMCAH